MTAGARRGGWIALLSVAVVLAAGAGWSAYANRDDPIPPAASTGTPAERIGRGRYLAQAGDCVACHTARGGREFSGGNMIATPFGALYSPNITPDPKTGIGGWSAEDFWRALHNGRSRDGAVLYPAFPYPHYTKIVRDDADALFAYLKSLPPVERQNRQHQLRFPYSWRPLLAVWRALFFRPGEYVAVPAESAEWNRGAYLVLGPGHCGACHGKRNRLGATEEREFDGSLMPLGNWYAPPLVAIAGQSLPPLRGKELIDFLKVGATGEAVALGPMAEVVAHSTQFWSDADVAAAAKFLDSLQDRAGVKPILAAAAPVEDAAFAEGAKLYKTRCKDCHGESGEGQPGKFPKLAGNRTLLASIPANAVQVTVNGGYPPATAGNPRPYGMPPFNNVMTDADIAHVLTYVRNSWGNAAPPVSVVEVGRYRRSPTE